VQATISPDRDGTSFIFPFGQPFTASISTQARRSDIHERGSFAPVCERPSFLLHAIGRPSPRTLKVFKYKLCRFVYAGTEPRSQCVKTF
jgi:hypothetical protein